MKKIDLADIALEYLINKHDRQEVLRCLRERKTPLPAKYCKELADFFDKPRLAGRPPLCKGEVAYATKRWQRNITRYDFVHVDALYRSLIGYPKCDIRSAWDARDATCESLGISERTYDKLRAQLKNHSFYTIQKQLAKQYFKQK